MCRFTYPRTQNKSSSLKRTYVKKTQLLIIKQLLDRQEPVALLRWKCTQEPFLQFCSTRLMLVLESALLVAPSNLLAPLGMCQPLHSSLVTASWVSALATLYATAMALSHLVGTCSPHRVTGSWAKGDCSSGPQRSSPTQNHSFKTGRCSCFTYYIKTNTKNQAK